MYKVPATCASSMHDITGGRHCHHDSSSRIVIIIMSIIITSHSLDILPEGGRGYRNVPTLIDSPTSGFLALEEAFFSGPAAQLGPRLLRCSASSCSRCWPCRSSSVQKSRLLSTNRFCSRGNTTPTTTTTTQTDASVCYTGMQAMPPVTYSQ